MLLSGMKLHACQLKNYFVDLACMVQKVRPFNDSILWMPYIINEFSKLFVMSNRSRRQEAAIDSAMIQVTFGLLLVLNKQDKLL